MALRTVSHNMLCGLCVLQIVWVKQRKNTMVRYSFQEQAEMVLVYGQQLETIESQHECTEPRTLTGSATHITQHLEHLSAFLLTWVLWHRRTCRTAADFVYNSGGGTRSPWYWEQPWYKFQASGTPTWGKGRLSLSYMTTAIILVTSNVCGDYHRPIFLHGKDSVAGLCNRPLPLWNFCLRSSSPMKQSLAVMASLTCIIVICRLQTILTEWFKRLISSGSATLCRLGLLATPTWISSASTTHERRNVSGLPAKHAASIAEECAFGNTTDNVAAVRWSASPLPHQCSPTPQHRLPQTLNRTWKACYMACSITDLNPCILNSGCIWKSLCTVSLFLKFRPFNSVCT